MNFMESLCAKCPHHDWDTMRDVRAAYKSAHLQLPKHAWCRLTDRPEDVRWKTCSYIGDIADR